MADRTELIVRPLTPARFGDLAVLFEEGGDPKWCWCMYFRARGRDWSNSTAAGNRAELRSLTERDDLAPGLVAYRDGVAVGWVSLAPREDYERLAYSKVLAPVDDTPVWSIVCFLVDRRVRGRGLAERMLRAAVDHARAHGARLVEAYPVDAGEQKSPDEMFVGAKSMYDRAGFREVARRRPTRPVVRRPFARDVRTPELGLPFRPSRVRTCRLSDLRCSARGVDLGAPSVEASSDV